VGTERSLSLASSLAGIYISTLLSAREGLLQKQHTSEIRWAQLNQEAKGMNSLGPFSDIIIIISSLPHI
jgi:hypothetical protein